ncbi:protein-tyrosine phosphatase family protein [Nocardia macrotermitis]|uniref:Uncharacterized protein n=1 Tax=Nocardia macrotermitis TaxID=2585198 RepID=A0A7K0DBS4_9NOCA|nr:hypothetical protein [Nocardia macrotermitis]MQY23230.1 hypothetical protein [Nocardia macrotermitis]
MDHGAVEQFLETLKQAGSRSLDRDCARLAEQYFAERVEPQFTIWSADFDSDPSFILADRYWNLRFREEPTLHTAVECAGWLSEHAELVVAEPVREKWAMGYGFITRDSIDSAEEIADATADIIAGNPGGDRAYFAVLYQAAKLRSNHSFDELLEFLESSPLSVSIRRTFWDAVLFRALRAFAAFGAERTSSEYACGLAEKVWSSPDRTRESVDVVLNGLAVGKDFDRRGELLRTWSAEAVSLFPDDHMFLFRLAIGQRLCGDYADARISIGRAQKKLPKTGWRISHNLLQEQFEAEQRLIESQQAITRQMQTAREEMQQFMVNMTALVQESEKRIDTTIGRHEQKMQDLADSTQRGHTRAIEVVAFFAAVIAFAVGALDITLKGTESLSERSWLMAELGGGLLLFGVVIGAAMWLITRRG